jgi:hypothetical protein
MKIMAAERSESLWLLKRSHHFSKLRVSIHTKPQILKTGTVISFQGEIKCTFQNRIPDAPNRKVKGRI